MLSAEQVFLLRRAGFIDYEIAQYNYMVAADGSPQAVDLHTETWQATMKTRKLWIDRCRALGWVDQQIKDAIMNFYKGPRRSPFDFLKAEYKPVKRTDYIAARRSRARKKTKSLYQGGRKS